MRNRYIGGDPFNYFANFIISLYTTKITSVTNRQQLSVQWK